MFFLMDRDLLCSFYVYIQAYVCDVQTNTSFWKESFVYFQPTTIQVSNQSWVTGLSPWAIKNEPFQKAIHIIYHKVG